MSLCTEDNALLYYLRIILSNENLKYCFMGRLDNERTWGCKAEEAYYIQCCRYTMEDIM
jgi:hypothetical protein